ncbi:MAG: CarD family transcriptional regulator [Desulfohalobiaceae bacterium]|nr:CarD family transcriptional regulator [Desulfohalobiaceae bacterium]
MFEIDELVVYPAQGVGKVEDIQGKEMGGLMTRFYKIRILSNNGTLLIPVDNAANVGLRKVCAPEYGQQIFEYLKDWSDFKGYAGQNWNRRYREYSDKLKTGDLADVAYVLKELMLISQDKDLSFGEGRLMEQAMGLITMELAYTLNREQDAIRQEIEGIFSDILTKDS